MKIHSVGAKLFHADGQTRTDMVKLTVFFAILGGRPENTIITPLIVPFSA
jgi:hypothetical protein